ncbi:WXG100-like domain-containing protein [Mycobacterium sp. Dal123C01]|uniref:WXG100-like domain-containing protein n=1 Tax=Mycobacterium sp. Dal123C01 TaxID=3457577 RepID=UPI00403EB95C
MGDITIPAELQRVSYLVGQKWPQGSEHGMWSIADAWNGSAQHLAGVIPTLQQVSSQIPSALSGDTGAAVTQSLQALLSGDNSIPTLVTGMSALGSLAEETGTQIQYTKLQILSSLAIAAAEIAYALAMADWTFGGSLAWIPAIEGITRAAIRVIVAQLIRRLTTALAEALTETAIKKLFTSVLPKLAVTAAKEAVRDTVISEIQEFAIQGAQWGDGHRDGFDFKQIGEIALASSVGGVVGAGLHSPMSSLLGAPTSVAGKVVKGAITHYGVGFAANAAGAAATGGEFSALSLFGGPAIGAASGGVHGAVDHAHPSGGGSHGGDEKANGDDDLATLNGDPDKGPKADPALDDDDFNGDRTKLSDVPLDEDDRDTESVSDDTDWGSDAATLNNVPVAGRGGATTAVAEDGGGQESPAGGDGFQIVPVAGRGGATTSAAAEGTGSQQVTGGDGASQTAPVTSAVGGEASANLLGASSGSQSIVNDSLVGPNGVASHHGVPNVRPAEGPPNAGEPAAPAAVRNASSSGSSTSTTRTATDELNTTSAISEPSQRTSLSGNASGVRSTNTVGVPTARSALTVPSRAGDRGSSAGSSEEFSAPATQFKSEQLLVPDKGISGDPLLPHADTNPGDHITDHEGREQDSRRDGIGQAVAETIDPDDHGLPRVETTIEQIRPWLSQINVDVHGGDSRSRMFNCGQATIAVFDRLSGRAGFQTAAPLEGIWKNQLQGVTGFAPHRSSLEGIEALLRGQGSGAHAVVFVARRGPNGKSSAHAFNAFFDGAEVYALDGRDNSIQPWPPNFDAGDYKAVEWSVYAPSDLIPPQHLPERWESELHASPDDFPLTDLAHGTHDPSDNAPTQNDGESAERQLVRVPGGGWCLLHAVLVSTPPQYWPDMGSSIDARTQHAAVVEQMTARAADGPGTGGGALGQAAHALHQSVLQWVSGVDATQLPTDVVESYRQSQEQMDELERDLPSLTEDELLERLNDAGVTEAHERWMSPQVSRQRYIEARVRELTRRSDGSTGASLMSEQHARALGESEVNLKDQAKGWELDGEALGPSDQFRYLQAHNELPPLRQLDIDGLQTAVRETNARRPLTADEHRKLITAVRNWQSDTRGWNTSYGETFPALVAHALGIRLHNVRTPGVRDVGPAGSDRVVGIFYNGRDHYDGAIEPPHAETQHGTTSSRPEQSTPAPARDRDAAMKPHAPADPPGESGDASVRARQDRYTKALNDLKSVLAQGELDRLGPATAEAAAANRDLRQLRPEPATVDHDGSGPPDPQIPERIGPKMLIGGLDVMERFESEEGDAAFKFVEGLVRSKGGDEVWDANRQRIEALLSDNALRPQAAGMLRGGRTVKVEVDLGNGRFLTVELELSGEQSYLVFKEPVTGAGEDFEHTSDNTQTAVKTKGGIGRYFFFLRGSWTGRAASDSATFGLEYVADRQRSNLYADRQVSGTLTLREPATRFHGGIHATITSRLTGDSETTERPARSITYHTEVVVPTRDVNDRGEGDLGSPFGVATTGRLNGSDVVTNLWLLQDQGGTVTPNRASTDLSRSDGAHSGRSIQLSPRKPPVATVQDFVRSPGIAAAFKKAYPDSADQAMSEVVDKLDPADLQAHLHGMTNGQPREYRLTNGGRVQVFASIEPIDRDRVGQMMRKTGTLIGPEFHYGSELDTSQVRRKQRGLNVEIPTPGRFRGQDTSAEFVGGVDSVLFRGKTIRSVTNSVQYRWRNTLKHPTAGEAWRGQARLLFVMHPSPPKKLGTALLWRSSEGRPPNHDAGQAKALVDSTTATTSHDPQPATRDKKPIDAAQAEVPVPQSLQERLKASFEYEWHKRISMPLNERARAEASFKGAVYEGRAEFDVLVEKQGPPEKYMNGIVWRPPRGIWGPRPPVERNSITQRKIWDPRALAKRSSDAGHRAQRALILRGSQDALLTGLGSMYRVTNVDLHGFQGMVDAMGRQAYGGAKWNGIRRDGSSLRGDAASWYHLNRVRGALPAMTQQRALTHRGTKASFVANIHELTYLRDFVPLSSPGTELTTGYANTAFRDKQNHGHGSLGEDGETLLGEGIFGLDQSKRVGDELRAEQRESVVTKFDQRMAEYSGWVRIDGTIEGSMRFGSKRTVHESGLFPIQIAIPYTELAAQAQNPHDLPPTFRRDWPDGYFGKPPDADPVEHKSDAPLAEPDEPAVPEDEAPWLPDSLTRSGTENSLSSTRRGSLSSFFRLRSSSTSFPRQSFFRAEESPRSSLPGESLHGPSSADAPVDSPIYDEPDSIELASPDDVTHGAESPVVGLRTRTSSLVPNTALETLPEGVQVASFAEPVDDRTAPAASSTDDGIGPSDRRYATPLPPAGPASPTGTGRLARLRGILAPLLTSGHAPDGQTSKRYGSADPQTHSPDSDGDDSEVESSVSGRDTPSPTRVSRQVTFERSGSDSPSSLAATRRATSPETGLMRRLFQRQMSDPSLRELSTTEHGSSETASPVAGPRRKVSRIGVPPPSPAAVTGTTTAAGPSRRATLDLEIALREQQPSFAAQGEMLLKVAALPGREADTDLKPDWQKSEEPKDPPSPPKHAALPSGHPYDMLIGLDPLTALSDAIHDDLRGVLRYASETDVDGLSDAFGDRVLLPRATHQFGQEWSHRISVLGGAGHITVKVRLVRDEQAKYVGQSAKFDSDVTTDPRFASAHSQRDVLSRVVGGRLAAPVPHGTVSAQLTHSHSTDLPYRLRDPKSSQKRSAASNVAVTQEVREPGRARMIDLHELFRHPVVAHISYEKHGAARALTDIPKEPQPVRLTGVFSYPAHTDISADTVPDQGGHHGGDQRTRPDLRLRPEQLVVKIRPHQGAAPVAVDAAATTGGPTPKEDLIANHVLGAMSKDGIAVFDDKWPSVRSEIAEHLQTNSLQGKLRNYADGDVTRVALKSLPGGEITFRGRIDAMVPVADKAQADLFTGHQQALSVNNSNITNSHYRAYLQGLFSALPGAPVNISLLGRLSGGLGNETVDVHTQATGTGLTLREVGPPKAHVGTATIEATMTRATVPKGRSATTEAQIDFMTREPQRNVRENMGTLGDHPKLSHDTIVGKIAGGDNFRTHAAENLPKQLSHKIKQEIEFRLDKFFGDSLIGGNIAKMIRKETNLLEYGSWRITGHADVTDLASPKIADKGASPNVYNEISRGQSRGTSSSREVGTRFEFGPRWGGSNSGSLLFGLGAMGQRNTGKSFGQSSRVTANGKSLRPYVVYDGTVSITLTVHVGGTAHTLPASKVSAPILIPDSEVQSAKPATKPSQVTAPGVTTSLPEPTVDTAADPHAGARLLTQEWGQDDWMANTINAAEAAAGLPVAGIAASPPSRAPLTGPTPQAPSVGTTGRAQPSARPPTVHVVHTTEGTSRSNDVIFQRMTRAMRALVSGLDGRPRQNDAGNSTADSRPPAEEADSGGTRDAAVQPGALPPSLGHEIPWLDDQWGADTMGATDAAAMRIAGQRDETGRRSQR